MMRLFVPCSVPCPLLRLLLRMRRRLCIAAGAPACLFLAWTAAQAQSPQCPPAAQVPTAEQVRRAQAQTRDRGFLWRISKDGRTSYLYGTIHVGRMEWTFPGPEVSRALAASKTLALELDPSDPAEVARMQAGMQARPPLPLPPTLRQRLDQQAAAACIPRAVLSALHPVMQAVTYTVLVGRWDGLDPAWAQETALARLAREARMPIVSLETVQLQSRLIVPDDPQEAVATIEQALAQLEQGRVRPMLVRMADIWEHSNFTELERFESWCECVTTADERLAMRRLLDERNPDLAEGIAAMHALGQEVFAAVGALHMVGPTGLPRLLAAKGFRVERVDFAR